MDLRTKNTLHLPPGSGAVLISPLLEGGAGVSKGGPVTGQLDVQMYSCLG